MHPCNQAEEITFTVFTIDEEVEFSSTSKSVVQLSGQRMDESISFSVC